MCLQQVPSHDVMKYWLTLHGPVGHHHPCRPGNTVGQDADDLSHKHSCPRSHCCSGHDLLDGLYPRACKDEVTNRARQHPCGIFQDACPYASLSRQQPVTPAILTGTHGAVLLQFISRLDDVLDDVDRSLVMQAAEIGGRAPRGKQGSPECSEGPCFPPGAG